MYRLLGLAVPEPRDLVHEAIMLAYCQATDDSNRRWDQEKCPDLAQFLIGIVRSITSNGVTKLVKRREQSLHSDDPVVRGRIEREISTSSFTSETLDPEQLLLREERAKEIIEHLNRVSQGDEEVQMMMLCYEDGISSPRGIAEQTGYDVKQVYKIRERLQKRLNNLSPSVTNSRKRA